MGCDAYADEYGGVVVKFYSYDTGIYLGEFCNLRLDPHEKITVEWERGYER